MKKHKADILLVEDDQNLGFILQDYLQMEGYRVNLQKDGLAGLESFRNGSFDICIFQ